MAVINNIKKAVTDAQIQSAAIYPTAPYKGTLPTANIKKGNQGKQVKALQTFLNWCIKAGLSVDGACGPKTVSAIKKFQKQYKLKVDGVFGPQSRAKAKAIVKKYAPKTTTTTVKKTTTKPIIWVDNANKWAKVKAANNSWHYVKWSSNSKTHECPVCYKHPKGKFHGWNCIGFAWAVWHHGGGIPCACNCHVIANNIGNKMYRVKTTAEALKIAQHYSKLKNIKVIRNRKGIPKSQWKAGDICLQFSGSTYVHAFYYMGNGKVADAIGSSGTVPNDKQIAVRSYQKYSCKIIIRYMGK